MTRLGFLGFEMPQQMAHFLEECVILWETLNTRLSNIMLFKVLKMVFNIYFLFPTQIDQLLVQQKVELVEGNVVCFFYLYIFLLILYEYFACVEIK